METERDESNKAAINRVTYLGGILLPFTVVAGVLSMDGPFSPGSRLFWVFWAISIPLTMLTVLVIYADNIRRLEVWVEVSPETLEESVGWEDMRVLYEDEGRLWGDHRNHGNHGNQRHASVVGRQKRRRSPVNLHFPAASEQPRQPRQKADKADREIRVTPGAASRDPRTISVDDDVQEIILEVVGAQKRRRFVLTDPLGDEASATIRMLSMASALLQPDDEQQTNGRASGEEGRERVRHQTSHGARLYESAHVLRRTGKEAKAWRRQQLGWVGAAKSLVSRLS